MAFLLLHKKANSTYQKIMKKFVKVCLHSSYTVKNSFHFDEIFYKNFKIPINVTPSSGNFRLFWNLLFLLAIFWFLPYVQVIWKLRCWLHTGHKSSSCEIPFDVHLHVLFQSSIRNLDIWPYFSRNARCASDNWSQECLFCWKEEIKMCIFVLDFFFYENVEEKMVVKIISSRPLDVLPILTHLTFLFHLLLSRAPYPI